jgi:hypothetical protein
MAVLAVVSPMTTLAALAALTALTALAVTVIAVGSTLVHVGHDSTLEHWMLRVKKLADACS